jgi:hypothetical protein
LDRLSVATARTPRRAARLARRPLRFACVGILPLLSHVSPTSYVSHVFSLPSLCTHFLGPHFQPGAVSVLNCTCMAGHIPPSEEETEGVSCMPCPPATFKPHTGNGNLSFFVLLATSTPLILLFFSPSPGTCTPCATGYESVLGAAQCTDIDECMEAQSCESSFVCHNTFGKLCLWLASLRRSWLLTLFRVAGGYMCSCPSGSSLSGSVCVECPVGSFKAGNGNHSCSLCPANTTTGS